jgi:hypothetical protein
MVLILYLIVFCLCILTRCLKHQNTPNNDINNNMYTGNVFRCTSRKYRNTPVAVFTHYEVELYRGRTDHEICLSALDIDTNNLEPDIIRYVHTKHPDDKVQFTPLYHEWKYKK